MRLVLRRLRLMSVPFATREESWEHLRFALRDLDAIESLAHCLRYATGRRTAGHTN
ncbi:hypothetical protein ONA70_17610 [Micromonospora yasonensis]|uniref:hypothetical protein n=1 Tax=Micromonospora yasonensis TaxID=1128667 RepID=UPI00222ECF61|nr:hypothetical protein [Micromonospora yasonensis]MCW3841918.1 hypothetical protein [Micromonospora yasonensis]